MRFNAGSRVSSSTICPRAGRTAEGSSGTPSTSVDQLPAASTMRSADDARAVFENDAPYHARFAATART